jgi:hypothetical protein
MPDIFITVYTEDGSEQKAPAEISMESGAVVVAANGVIALEADPLMAYWLGRALMDHAREAVKPIVITDPQAGG